MPTNCDESGGMARSVVKLGSAVVAGDDGALRRDVLASV